jgi:hypothetical protein
LHARVVVAIQMENLPTLEQKPIYFVLFNGHLVRLCVFTYRTVGKCTHIFIFYKKSGCFAGFPDKTAAQKIKKQ